MVSPLTAMIDTSPVDLRTAAAIEAAEARAWADLYAAAPSDFAEAAGLATREVGGALLLRWAATGRRYFNRAIGLGITMPATPETLDEIIGYYERSGISMFLLQSLPHCRPAAYEGWLRERGLEPFDAQDRIIRGGEPAAAPGPLPTGRRFAVERVSPETADEWAQFMQRVYHLETDHWLQALIERPGWHQYVAREDDDIVAARGMCITAGGMAWWGMDGPVPGVTTDDYEPDAAVCEHMVRDGLAHGARSFLADIEAPSEARDTPAYQYFSRLGFRRPYVRTHHARV
jgi:hypothetical protein